MANISRKLGENCQNSISGHFGSVQVGSGEFFKSLNRVTRTEMRALLVSEPECPLCSLSPCRPGGGMIPGPIYLLFLLPIHYATNALSSANSRSGGSQVSQVGLGGRVKWQTRCKLCYSGESFDLRSSGGGILKYGNKEPEGT